MFASNRKLTPKFHFFFYLPYRCVMMITIINTFTAIVDLSRSNFSIARVPLFQLKSAT